MMMATITTSALFAVWQQDAGSLSSGNSQMLTIFVGIAAVALLMLGTAFVVLAVVAVKLQKKVSDVIDQVKVKAMPMIGSANTIISDLTPKIKVVSENVTEMSHVIRAKVQEFDATLTGVNQTVRDANQKTKTQVSRVDDLVTTTLSRTAAIADTIHNSIRTPVKEVAGVVNGFKAGLDVLMNRAKDFGGPRV